MEVQQLNVRDAVEHALLDLFRDEARPKPLRYCNYKAAIELYRQRVDEHNALVPSDDPNWIPDSRTLARIRYLRRWIEAAHKETLTL